MSKWKYSSEVEVLQFVHFVCYTVLMNILYPFNNNMLNVVNVLNTADLVISCLLVT